MKGYPLQYSGLENSMDSIVHGVAKSGTRLSAIHFTSLSVIKGLTTQALWRRGQRLENTPAVFLLEDDLYVGYAGAAAWYLWFQEPEWRS